MITLKVDQAQKMSQIVKALTLSLGVLSVLETMNLTMRQLVVVRDLKDKLNETFDVANKFFWEVDNGN